MSVQSDGDRLFLGNHAKEVLSELCLIKVPREESLLERSIPSGLSVDHVSALKLQTQTVILSGKS